MYLKVVGTGRRCLLCFSTSHEIIESYCRFQRMTADIPAFGAALGIAVLIGSYPAVLFLLAIEPEERRQLRTLAGRGGS